MKNTSTALLGIALATSVAMGGSILPEGFDITCQLAGSDGVWSAQNNQGDFEVNPETGAISGASAGNAWSAEWDSIAFTSNPSLTTAWAFTNTTGSTQTFTVTFTTPISAISGQLEMFGSITGGLTANTPGTAAEIWAPTGGSIYTAYVDGVAVSPTLMNDPFHVATNPPTATAPLGFESFEFEPGPASAMNSISIEHTFTLTAGDSVTFNSAFQIIPAPAGIALFAMFGLGASRRRRS